MEQPLVHVAVSSSPMEAAKVYIQGANLTKIAEVVGAMGDGSSPLTRENCSELVRFAEEQQPIVQESHSTALSSILRLLRHMEQTLIQRELDSLARAEALAGKP